MAARGESGAIGPSAVCARLSAAIRHSASANAKRANAKRRGKTRKRGSNDITGRDFDQNRGAARGPESIPVGLVVGSRSLVSLGHLAARRARAAYREGLCARREPLLLVGVRYFSRLFRVVPMSLGVGATRTPAASSAAILSLAAPLPPLMIAPAWPMRLPGGAVVPAMKPATGFFMYL